MQDQHKQQIFARIEHDRQRQLDFEQKLVQTREAKRLINEELRARLATKHVSSCKNMTSCPKIQCELPGFGLQEEEKMQDATRLAGMRKSRVEREETLLRRRHELQDENVRRQVRVLQYTTSHAVG